MAGIVGAAGVCEVGEVEAGFLEFGLEVDEVAVGADFADAEDVGIGGGDEFDEGLDFVVGFEGVDAFPVLVAGHGEVVLEIVGKKAEAVVGGGGFGGFLVGLGRGGDGSGGGGGLGARGGSGGGSGCGWFGPLGGGFVLFAAGKDEEECHEKRPNEGRGAERFGAVSGGRGSHSGVVVSLFLGGHFLAGHFLGLDCVGFLFDIDFGAFDFVFEFGAGLFELAHALAEAAGQFGDFFGAEEEEDHHEDDHDLRATEVECEDVHQEGLMSSEARLISSSNSVRAFLNSPMLLPRPRASSGIFLAPKRRRTTTKMTMTSGPPRLNARNEFTEVG